MCGIAGYVGDSNPEQGEKALWAMAYRGPDGWGDWSSPENGVWLGHRRLAVIDPEDGHQPFSSPDGTLCITYNGCIYNYVELYEQLKNKGYNFRTQSDTEVLLYAYAEYGEACVNHLNGMFAFAIWDNHKKRLFCARDQVGIKPFYYQIKNGTFQFASEIKALLAMHPESHQPNPDALQEYLTFQVMLDEKTLFPGIHKLLPGHTLTFYPETKQLDICQYWELEFNWDQETSEEVFAEQLYALLQDSIRIRLRSDVAVGAHLSGGMDSSAVVCMMRQILGAASPIQTFTGAFNEGETFDETRYARIVSGFADTENHEIYLTSDDFIHTIEQIAYHMDEPAAGPGVFPQFLVSKAAAQKVKVVLGGQGGDEIFGGYARYLICYLENALRGCIQGGGHSDHYAHVLSSLAPHLSMLAKYQPMLKNFWSEGLFESQERRYFRLMDRSGNAQELFVPELFEQVQPLQIRFNRIFNGSNTQSLLDKMLYFDMKVHLPGLLQVEDRASMAWGLESRVPLLDHRIIELMATVPPLIKFKGGQPKHLFRQALMGVLPREVFNRTDKMGFPVPLSRWYHGNLHGFIREILLDERTAQRGIFNQKAMEKAITGEQEFGRAIWGALNLELWFRSFVDQPVRSVVQPPVMEGVADSLC